MPAKKSAPKVKTQAKTVKAVPLVPTEKYQKARRTLPAGNYIQVSPETAELLMRLSQSRRLPASDLIRIALANIQDAPKFLGLSDRIGFGKYRDELVGTVIKAHPAYIEWALKNVERFKLDPEAHELLNEQLEAITS